MMQGKERFSGWVFCVLVVQNVLSCVQSLPVGAANDGGDGGTADDGGQFGSYNKCVVFVVRSYYYIM